MLATGNDDNLLDLPDEELVVDIKQEHVILTSSMTTEMKVFYTTIVNARGDSTEEEQERQKTLAKELNQDTMHLNRAIQYIIKDLLWQKTKAQLCR